MPLAKQSVSISFGQGVATKDDPFQIPTGKLARLENGVFTSRNRIKKRNGYRDLGKQVIGTTDDLTFGKGLASYQDELVLFDGGDLYSFDVGNESWMKQGPLVSVNVRQRPVCRNTYRQTAQDSTSHPIGLQCFVWEDSDGGARYSVVDSSTGLNVVYNAVLHASGSRPKVLSLGNNILIFYVAGTSLYRTSISVATPNVLSTPVAVTNSLLGATPEYDAAVIGQRCFVSWNDASNKIFTTAIRTDLSGPDTASFSSAAALALSTFADSTGQNIVLGYYDGTAVKFRVYDYGLGSVVHTDTTVETLSNVVSMTGASTGTAVFNSFKLFYTVSDANPQKYLVRSCNVTSYAPGSASVFLRSVALASKAFKAGGVVYVTLSHQSPTDTDLQDTYFVADSTGSLVAKLLYSLGGGHGTRPLLTEVNQVSTSQFQLSLLPKDALTTTGGQVFTQTGVESVTLDFFDTKNSYLRAELAETLHLSGGFLQMYDGVSPVEHGFHLFPEGVTVANPASTNFVYQYVACYEWTDNRGNVHRSAPSPAVTTGQAFAIDNEVVVDVHVPTLRLTAKRSASRSHVSIVVYRTEANGTLFYRVSSITSPLYNDPTADEVVFNDRIPDAELIGNPPLYTTGGVIENIAPNAVSGLTVWKNRIVAIDSMNPLQLWLSKQVVPGTPVEFSDLLTYNVSPIGGGRVTAVANLDEKLIIFKENSILVTAGEGPTATGAQNDMPDAQLISSEAGCVNPRSVVLTSEGLLFKSAKGIYLLDRGMQVSYKGLDVEAWNDDEITSAQTLGDANQVRFTLDSGIALVYDSLFGQWSVFTNLAATDSTRFQGLFTYIRSDGIVRQETPGVFSDSGTPVKLRLVIPWLKFAGLQGFQRVYKMLVLGEYLSPHRLLVQVAQDFNPAPVQEVLIDSQGAFGSPIFGEDEDVYGGEGVSDSNVYGGKYPLHQWRLFFTRQKCEALQLTIEDVQTETGEGLSLSGLTLEIGVKKGAWKPSATRSVG